MMGAIISESAWQAHLRFLISVLNGVRRYRLVMISKRLFGRQAPLEIPQIRE